MIETIDFKGDTYPAMQAKGNMTQYAKAYASHVCQGRGYDIGCCKVEWSLPGATPIDQDFPDGWHANNLPVQLVDYIYSSHCLEHVDDWGRTLDYWTSRLKTGGTIFLYLPHKTQRYWLPWHNTKHNHMFEPSDIMSYMFDNGYKNVFVSGRDLCHSFMAMGEKA